jgi:hypothetical protein
MTLSPPTLDYESQMRGPGVLQPRMRKVVVALLLVVGVQAWLLFGSGYWGRNVQLMLLAASLVLALLVALIATLIPNLGHAYSAALDRVRHPSRLTLALLSVLIAAGATIYLYSDARYQKRTFTPKYHDEFSYIIQTRMVAQGRLWAPSPPAPWPEFFESFQLITYPQYASIYFPGSAMIYAPGVWFGWPAWVMPLLLSGAIVGLTFRLIAELTDAILGFLAALMMLGIPVFRLQSFMVMAQIPSLFFALVMMLAWLRWREKHRIGWAILIGLCAGWCAIIRPLDALCVTVPVGIATLSDFRRARGRRLATIGAIALAAAPFLLLQAGFNKVISGRVLRTPFEYYARHYFPQTTYGFHAFNPNIRPLSSLPQMQAYYDNVALPFIKGHTPARMLNNWKENRFRLTVLTDAPTWLMIGLMPVGLMGVTDPRRWVVWSMLPLFVVLYFFYTFFLAHYPLIAAPAVLLNILLGVEVIRTTWPRAQVFTMTFLLLALICLSVTELPETNRVAHDEWFDAPQLQRIDQTIATKVKAPAIVLFRFGGSANPEEEPVYNIDVVHPDQARIIRAHDLGPEKNLELYRYYASRSPDRSVYRYDRADDSLTFLGDVRDLARGQ